MRFIEFTLLKKILLRAIVNDSAWSPSKPNTHLDLHVLFEEVDRIFPVAVRLHPLLKDNKRMVWPKSIVKKYRTGRVGTSHGG
jgi:hypothetical protein